MRHQFKYRILIISLSVFLSLSCKKKKIVPTITPCDLSNSIITQEESYNFDVPFETFFSQSTRWESNNADITLVNEKGQLTANSSNTSQALETWKLYNTQMPYNKSWSIEASCTVPVTS